ncbi:hypothetical protein R1sor_001240 [Riccia sorocarpa]|uniref:Uncharacterized protein n=1 Tax=Riccia sorocarpa TaxID=122646 RepID=A0ABD3GVQ7_9MARC
MRLVVDSPAVQHVEQTWPEFRRDPRHLCFGLASDGVSPYGVKSFSHSTWPVVLMNYNVPPWLANKKGFLLLALIIQGPKKVKNIDIYLWFTLKGVLLWTMHDYPGYAQVSGFQASVYAACPTCGPALPVARSSHLSKQVYMSYSTYLPMDDPLRGTGAERNNVAPPVPSDMNWWEQRWRDDLMIQHLLDPMHIEVNVTKSLIKRIFGEKDGKPARLACEEFGVHPEAWIQVSDGGIESLPPAPWILTTEERKIYKKRISEIRFPIDIQTSVDIIILGIYFSF